MFSPFQEALKRTINQHHLGDIVVASQICHQFAARKAEFFPEDQKNAISAKAFKNATLTISVPNSVWANEVINRQKTIIAEMNTKYGQNVIQKIKTELENVASSEN